MSDITFDGDDTRQVACEAARMLSRTLLIVAAAAVALAGCSSLARQHVMSWQTQSASCGGLSASAPSSSSSSSSSSSHASRSSYDDDRGTSTATAEQEHPTCMMGSNGRQACGYHCMMGSDGRTACANTPDGVCAMGSDGHITCSQVASSSPGGPPPECHMTSRGRQRCGYNCRFGSNGDWYCASRPDGVCAFNSDGTFTCT